MVLGLFEMTFGLVHANYSLPKWQTVTLTFFALCFLVTALVYSSTFLPEFYLVYCKPANF